MTHAVLAFAAFAAAAAMLAAGCGEPEADGDKGGGSRPQAEPASSPGGRPGPAAPADAQQPSDRKPDPARENREPRKKDNPEAVASAERTAREYFEAKKNRDFAKLFDLTATVPRLMMMELSKSIAEKSDPAAKEMGFESADQVGKLTEKEFYVGFRTALAAKGRFVYPKDAVLESVGVGPEENLMELLNLEADLKGRKATLVLKDGTREEAALVEEEGRWLIWEK